MGNLIDKEKADKITKLFAKYNFFDLCRAVFCLNSWRYNRPLLQFYLTLNYSLCITKRNGNIKIETYDDFLSFCKAISQYYDGTLDDEIIPDFGEVKIPYYGTNYSVFLGTGYNFMFPFMENLEVLAKEINCTNEIEIVLNYVDHIVSTYGRVEQYDSKKYDSTKIVFPTEKYFNNVKNNYKTININDQNFLLNLLYREDRLIEETHFIQENGIYPLFNPSIIIDSINFLYNNCKALDFNRIANDSIYDALIKNYDLSPENNKIKRNVAILKNKENKKIIGDFFFNYLVLDQDTLLFLINRNQHSDKDLDKIISQVKDNFSSKELYCVEPINPPECKLYDFSFINNITFLLYDDKVLLGNYYESKNFSHGTNVNLYDLISIIYQSQSSRELVDFFNAKDLFDFVLPYNGYSAIFEAWLMQNKVISQGATDVKSIFTDVYLVEWHVFEKFIGLISWYPFYPYNMMFSNPFAWTVESKQSLGFRRMICNNSYGFNVCCRKVNDSYLLLAFNMTFEDDNNYNIRSENIRFVEELIERNIVIIEQELVKCNFYNFNYIQFLYMPKNYAYKVDKNGFLNKTREYVYSDANYRDDKLLIRYTVNEEKALADILNSKDKIVECKFMEELLSCLDGKFAIDFNDIKAVLDAKKHDKKDIEAISLELKYDFSNKNLGFWPEDDVFIKVRKKVAYDCKNAGINPGIYSSKNATEIVRKIQKITIPNFETIISKYDKVSLHYYLLSNVAYYIHSKRLEGNRYSVVDNKLLSDEAKAHTAERTIELREESRERIKDITYLIDTNLSIRRDGGITPSYDELKYLLAYSHWLLVLQEISDQTNYDLFDSKIQINDDFIVSTILPKNFSDNLLKRQKRIYDNTDYVPTNKHKEEKFKESLEAFYNDTGIHLDVVMKTCEYLSKEFRYTFPEQDIPDVYRIKKEKLVEDYTSILVEKSTENISHFSQALDYLTIDGSKIKSIGGEKTEFVPVWEREKREVRFEVRPILRVGEDLIFSPVVMYELFQAWLLGTFDFYPPYEYGLDTYRKCLDNWKSLYEKQMETDISVFFTSLGFSVKKNLKLHKLDKKYGHPNDLGDYDIIAIDNKNKIIWNIESKFLGKVGSIKEYYNHQNSFFIKDKKDEKFSRRIEYLSIHKKEVLRALGIMKGNEYSIKNFMVTNKVFTSELKKVNFEIITFDELKRSFKLVVGF